MSDRLAALVFAVLLGWCAATAAMFRPSYARAAHLMAMALSAMSLARTAEHHFYGRSSAHKPDHTRVRGKAYPQHGARECARRVRQMEKAEKAHA